MFFLTRKTDQKSQKSSLSGQLLSEGITPHRRDGRDRAPTHQRLPKRRCEVANALAHETGDVQESDDFETLRVDRAAYVFCVQKCKSVMMDSTELPSNRHHKTQALLLPGQVRALRTGS